MAGWNTIKPYPGTKLFSALWVALLLILLPAASGYARPDMQPLGENIADKGSSRFHFNVQQFNSADQQRHYTVWAAIPNQPPPPAGYPVLYMLDGNAVMDRLSEAFLEQLSAKTPLVIVAVGYQTRLPFDLTARAWDYIPPENTPEPVKASATRFGHKGGGSAEFRHLLENVIAPAMEKGVHINPAARGLWGHSFGGLFVIDTYLSSRFFSYYYSASPSLERDNFAVLKRLVSLTPAQFCHKQLEYMEGTGSKAPATDSNAPVNAALVLEQAEQAINTLRARGVNASARLYPGLTHGQVFNASFHSALLQMAEQPATAPTTTTCTNYH
ncbi:alpha/beta hydrolase [Mangrovibacter phragmitis]|uniref:alpha/beta hydrolase n=1 Tax=Mangrovibacter phragmitis TaxID=1691903 RepID=UPI003369E57B